jgi:hypothetical protein
VLSRVLKLRQPPSAEHFHVIAEFVLNDVARSRTLEPDVPPALQALELPWIACAARKRSSRSGLARPACPNSQDAAGVDVAITAFGGWVPSDLRRFLPLAVFLTCLAEMVLLPTRFFFASAISILLSEEAEDTCGTDA